MAYDPLRGKVVLYGGSNQTENNANTTVWEWNGAAWTQATLPNSPRPRNYSSMAYHNASGYVVMFGGLGSPNNTPYLDDTWLYGAGLPPSGCDTIDFNHDTLFPDTQDISDFLAVFAGAPCPTPQCGDIDFNNDGLFPDTADIDSLLSVFSGGTCL